MSYNLLHLITTYYRFGIILQLITSSYYSERQKSFDVHYKASGRMRTDLQWNMLLCNSNPAQ